MVDVAEQPPVQAQGSAGQLPQQRLLLHVESPSVASLESSSLTMESPSVSLEDEAFLVMSAASPGVSEGALVGATTENGDSELMEAQPQLANGEPHHGGESQAADSNGDTASATNTESACETGSGEATQEDEHEEHATIGEVTESSNPADSKEEKIEDVIAKIKSMLDCGIVEVLESGEILVLPKAWSTRASKTHGGKTYYVSPYGQTQWLRPPMRTNIGYKWVHEIEVTFGTGRLGLNLKQISGEPGQVFSDILVHIEEIYKLGNGMASPAEIYNWSVKPEKRLYVGMRMTAINGIPLTGCTYTDVLDRVNRLPRPLRIKFADISRGIVGRAKETPMQEETADEKEVRLNQTKQRDLRMEYLQVLVAHELHLQVWKISKGRIQKKEQEQKKKEEILTTQLDAMTEYQALLQQDAESLEQEMANLTQMLEQLALQEAGAVPSPEVAKTPALQERNMALDQEVKDLMHENEELRQERVQLEERLDSVQKELDAYGGDGEGSYVDVFSASFLGSYVERGSLDRQADNAKEELLTKVRNRRRQLDLELSEEEEEVRGNNSELVQLKRQMSGVIASARREDELISGEKSPQLILLETKVDALRKDLHETVTGMAAAAKEGNRARMDNLSIRRTGLKDELRKALDDVSKYEVEFNVRSSISDRRSTIDGSDYGARSSSGSFDEMSASGQIMDTGKFQELSVLRAKVDALRKDLHETVTAMAAAAKEGNRGRMDNLAIRRTGLKDELRTAMDEVAKLEVEFNVRPSISTTRSASTIEFGARLSSGSFDEMSTPRNTDIAKFQDRLSGLRSDLHDTVAQLARAASAKDAKLVKELSGRRLQLKEEVKAVQDEYQQLTRESLALPPRPPSFDRIVIDPFPLPNPRDRSTSQASSVSTASQASLAPSVDSIINYPATTTTTTLESGRLSGSASANALPTLTGQLMKHPSHSNEKGMFGNMSLRGVRERYCVLDGSGSLLYYKRKSDREPRGSVPLDDPALEVVYAKTEAKSSEFSICTPTHQNKFVAKTRDEMMKWVKALELTHAILMERRSGARLCGLHQSTLQGQESVVSNEDESGSSRVSDGGLAPMALAVAADADAARDRMSLSSQGHASTSGRQQQHRATLGF